MEAISDFILELIFAAVVVFGGGFFAMIRKYLKNKTQIDIGKFFDLEAINTALSRGKSIAKEKVGEKADKIEFKNETIKNALEYFDSQYPIWMEKYGIKEEKMKEWLEAKYDELEEFIENN